MIKHLKIKLLVVLTAVAMTGCGDFEDLNVNPNAPTITNPDYLFTEAIIAGVSMDGNRDFGVWAGLTASDEGLVREDDLYLPSELAIYTWKDCYAIIANLNEIIKMVEGDPYFVNKLAVTRIWKSYIFGRLTDLYGDIPYTEGGMGNSAAFIIDPVYDLQEDIYDDLINELEEAVEQINTVDDLGSFGKADIIYEGDPEKWIRFANSLRLRMALRMSKANPEKAAAVVTSLMNEDRFMKSNEDGFHFQFNKDIKAATYYFYLAGLARTVPSKFLIDLLMETNDPRLAVYAQHPVKGDSVDSYMGMPNGLTVDQRLQAGLNFNTVSHIGSYFLREDIVGFTLSYAEVCFMQAEAAMHGWGTSPAMAGSFYNEGVRAAMTFFKSYTAVNELQRDPFNEISSEEIDSYLEGAGKFEGTDAEKLEKIYTQRWLVLYQEGGYEAFALVRRTHYPAIEDQNGNPIDLDHAYIQRMPYPVEEYSLNGDNTTEAADRQGDIIWWAR